jgi:serine/threonine protein kinase
VLHDKYLLSKEESIMIASFINPMLHLHPDKRATASETLEHELISGIVVQGEVDQLVRQEEDARRAQIRSESSGSIGSPMQEVLSSSEVPPSGPVASSGGGGKKKKKKNRGSAALAKVDAEAIEVAEATNARRAADDASAMKPIDEAVYAAAAAASADPGTNINGNGGPVPVSNAGSSSRASTSRGGKSKSHSAGGQGRNTST